MEIIIQAEKEISSYFKSIAPCWYKLFTCHNRHWIPKHESIVYTLAIESWAAKQT